MSKDSENTENKNGRGYHSMLKAVDDLVSKEGKNIKDAIDIAEQKISEWGGLGHQEANKIRDEVQHDLSSLGETIEHAKTSFREKWELDSQYLSDAIWSKLSSVADKTSLALMEFREELDERAKEAKENLHEREEHEYRSWHSDRQQWFDEIKTWQKEYVQAEQVLLTIQEKVRERSNVLDQYAKALSEYQPPEQDTTVSSGGISDELDPEETNSTNENIHVEMKNRREKETTTHQKLKENHSKIIASITELNQIM